MEVKGRKLKIHPDLLAMENVISIFTYNEAAYLEDRLGNAIGTLMGGKSRPVKATNFYGRYFFDLNGEYIKDLKLPASCELGQQLRPAQVNGTTCY